MTKDIFDSDLHHYLNDDDKNECKQCGIEIAEEKTFCCKDCFDAYLS